MPGFATTDWAKAFGWLRARTGTDLAPAQQDAVRLALTSKVAVLTGGPGCGKSFTVRAIVALARPRKPSPAGRAHRPGRQTPRRTHRPTRRHHPPPAGAAARRRRHYDRDNPLDVDLLVVDEASMLDLILANKLVKAVPRRRAPAAGRRRRPAPLRRRRGSAARPARRRRCPAGAADRGLPPGRAVRHRRQRPPHQRRPPPPHRLPDFFLFPCDDTETPATRRTASSSSTAARRIPAKFGIDPRRDIQVLAPMHRGPAGAGALNTLLQQRSPRPRRAAGAAGRRTGLPDRRQGHPDPQQLRQGPGRRLQRHPRRHHRHVHDEQTLTVRTDEDEPSTTTSTNSTNSSTPTP